jgi:thymidylate synthase
MHGRQLLRQDSFHTGEVHAMDTSGIPQYATRELLNVSMHFDLPGDVDTWAELTRPNREWAEEHFAERVSGKPLNPAPSHVRWPYAQKNNAQHVDDNKQFSHTYPERFWPRWNVNAITMKPGFWNHHRTIQIGDDVEVTNDHEDVVWKGTSEEFNQAMVASGHGTHPERKGVRYRYGDLRDVLNLMERSLYTRQAYLPVWFPEDTGAVDKQRVPCTIGYHFIVRPSGIDEAPDRLHMVYYMRSCDYVRYLRDDIYMAGRLGQWVANKLTIQGHEIIPDSLTLHITSLHSFVGDDYVIRKMVRDDAS